MFFREGLFRNKEKIVIALKWSVLHGTTMVTDGSKWCFSLETQGFRHLTFNHSFNFWLSNRRCKKASYRKWVVCFEAKFLSIFINSRSDISFFSIEFMFKPKFKNNSLMLIMEVLNKFEHIYFLNVFLKKKIKIIKNNIPEVLINHSYRGHTIIRYCSKIFIFNFLKKG